MQARMRNLVALAVAMGGVVLAGAALLSFDGEKSAPSRPQSGAQVHPVAPVTAEPTDERFVIKRILPIKGAIKYGEWHWDEAGVPDGPMVITVDLDARVLSAWRGGYEIGTTAVLLGTQEKPTPLGAFPIKMKDADHHSSTYDNAPMPFTLRLTDDGVSIHGTKVENGYASHGCIGVPTPFAKKLFAIEKVGDKVYITRGHMVGMGDSLVGG